MSDVKRYNRPSSVSTASQKAVPDLTTSWNPQASTGSDQKTVFATAPQKVLGIRDQHPCSKSNRRWWKSTKVNPFRLRQRHGCNQVMQNEKRKNNHAATRSGWKTSLAAMGGEEKVGTHLGSFWMLSMDGDLAKVPSGGRAGPDLLYGDSTEGQYCSCR